MFTIVDKDFKHNNKEYWYRAEVCFSTYCSPATPSGPEEGSIDINDISILEVTEYFTSRKDREIVPSEELKTAITEDIYEQDLTEGE